MDDMHDEECLPPTEFILSTIKQEKCDGGGHLEGNYSCPAVSDDAKCEEGLSYNVHCSNCLRQAKGLLCPQCITAQTSLPERRQALVCLRDQRYKLIDSYRRKWNTNENENIVPEDESVGVALEMKSELVSNIGRLSTIIRLKQEAINRNLERLRTIQSERSHRLRAATNLRQLVDVTTKKLCFSSHAVSHASLERRRCDLAGVRQRFVTDLLSNIFAIDIVSTPSTSSQVGAGSTSSTDEFESITGMADILKDAALTTFLCDRWIFMGTATVQYRLVHSCIVPDHGDYSVLKEWLFNEAASNGRPAPAEAVANPVLATLEYPASDRMALGILSSLAYGAQFVNVLSRICDVRLPFPLTFTDFFIDKLKEAELDTAIVKLNANVAFLCCSQRMDYDSVCFERPFWSLCNLSKNIKDLGYRSYFTVDARVARGFANAEKSIAWLERVPVTISETSDDWENIDERVPEWTGAASSPPSFSQLWSSAATSVASLFKMHN